MNGNDGTNGCFILLKNIIFIDICSREPGQHMLVEQCPVGVSGDQFAVQNYETL
jgi:hypothetical protein